MDGLDREKTAERFNQHVEHLLAHKGYAATPEGRAIVNRCLTDLAEFIADKRKRRLSPRKRPMQSLTLELWRTIHGLPDKALAQAAITGALNAIWAYRPDDSAQLLAKLKIGEEIELQARGAAIRRANSKAASEITKATRRRNTAKGRRRLERQILDRYADMARAAGVQPFRWRVWGDERKLVAGNWALDCLYQALPDVFCAGPTGLPSIRESAIEQAAAFTHALMMRHPVYMPMLKRPSPWSDFKDKNGTTFVRSPRNETAIRRAMVGGQMRAHVDAVNAAQSVGYQINEDVLNFVERLPSSPEGRRLLKKVNLERASERGVFALDMAAARELAGKRFYLRHNIDFRGRMYPLAFFNPTRADHVRALFKFARGERIGAGGINKLILAAATAFGSTRTRLYAERYMWWEVNCDRINAVASDPMEHLDWLSSAADPIQFYATAVELQKALEVGRDFITTLPIPFDASCSGAQHYSLLGRNSEGARLTNLMFTDDIKVECLYSTVLHHIKRQVASANLVVAFVDERADEDVAAQWWFDRPALFDRSLFKHLVMIHFYGSESKGLRLAVYDELYERGLTKNEIPKTAVNYLVRTVQETLEEVARGAPVIMRYLRKIARELAEKGKAVEWISPTGLPVKNLYQEAVVKRMQVWLGDKVKRHYVAHGYGRFQPVKAENAIAPNFVHTMDAAHLVFVKNACAREGIDLFSVHDSHAVLASRAKRLNEILRQELVHLYANADPLTNVRASAAKMLGPKAALLPAVPPKGDFDLNQVLNATYAFS
jgi:DNA-directed RNA polymerase